MYCYFLLMPLLLQAVTVIQNMARQHKEFQVRLKDAEKLWLYAGFATSKHQAVKESLSKAKSWSRH